MFYAEIITNRITITTLNTVQSINRLNCIFLYIYISSSFDIANRSKSSKKCFEICSVSATKFIIMEKGLLPHQQRVVEEFAEVKERASNLGSFILDNPIYLGLPDEEKADMEVQYPQP